jgi:transposase
MAIADRSGLPVAICTTSASPHEITLVEGTLDEFWVDEEPLKLIGDKAYDSEHLALKLAHERGVEMIAPPKNNNKQNMAWTADAQHAYKNRWKIERLFSWFHQFRQVVTRWEFYAENFRGFVQFASILILLKSF